MYGLQNMLQMQMINKVMLNLSFLNTGDKFLDSIINTIVQALIITFVSLIVSQLGKIISLITTGVTNIYNNSCFAAIRLYYFVKNKLRKESKKYPRCVDIPYISDNRQINELYKAVFWFLTNDTETDYLREPYLQYVFDKKITLDTKDDVKKNLSIHKVLSQQKTKTIKYMNHDIKYSLSTELITVYTDKDRKRENYKVTLWTEIDECEQKDILDDFCKFCLTEYINNLTSSVWTQQIYTNSNGQWVASPSNNSRSIDTIILKDNLKNEIKNDLQLFLNSESWYKERDIPYSRGYLFYGLPGTGKTSMIKAISLYSKRHIHYLMLSEVKSDAELIDLLKKINYKETVLVIEDIDAMSKIVKSREQVSKSSESDIDEESETKKKEESRLTLSGLLNAIDGVFTCHGRILIMTTNHPEVLDSALIRPGRVDSKYLFDNCNIDQIKDLYEMFFSKRADNDQLNNIQNSKYSPAHISSVFLRYRNYPEEALMHLDDECTKITNFTNN